MLRTSSLEDKVCRICGMFFEVFLMDETGSKEVFHDEMNVGHAHVCHLRHFVFEMHRRLFEIPDLCFYPVYHRHSSVNRRYFLLVVA